jgi:hypothetical protein
MGLPNDDISVNLVVEAIKSELENKDEYPIYLTEAEVGILARNVLEK